MSSPTRHQITVYTKDNCPLCDEAIRVVRMGVKGLPVDLNIVDISEDNALLKQYGQTVPVVAIDEKPLFYGKVSPFRLKKVLEGEGISARYQAFLRHLPSLFRKKVP